MKNCLIIGYGSIGQRHCDVLRTMGHKVSVVSVHLEIDAGLDFSVYRSAEEAFKAERYDYVIIASATKDHAFSLKQILPFLSADTICFVEKPLFAAPIDKVEWDDVKICVGYILRAHPLLRKVSKIINGKKIYSCRASCGQYLPSWRPNTDYTKCYSAIKEAGGGVLRDLSHELDYIQMLCGNWKNVTAIGGKFSKLQISSDDQYGILFSTEKCPLCMCCIDYLSRDIHRDLFIEYEDGSLHLDFINGTLLHNGNIEKISIARNDLFITMHGEVMNGNFDYFPEGLEAFETVKLIYAAERAAGKGVWIENR